MFRYSKIGAAEHLRFSLASIILCFSAAAVGAQESATAESCYPHITYAIMLADTLGQKKKVGGTEIRGNLMELYANPKSGTWTLVLVLPQGLACEIGNGTDFEIDPTHTIHEAS